MKKYKIRHINLNKLEKLILKKLKNRYTDYENAYVIFESLEANMDEKGEIGVYGYTLSGTFGRYKDDDYKLNEEYSFCIHFDKDDSLEYLCGQIMS